MASPGGAKMQPLSHDDDNVLEGLKRLSDVPMSELQAGDDILYRHGGRIEMDLIAKA